MFIFRYNEYDEMIKSAIRDQIGEEAKPAPAGKELMPEDAKEVDDGSRKPISEEKKESKKASDSEESRNAEDEEEIPAVVPRHRKGNAAKKKKKKLNSLDFTSDEDDDPNADSDFKGT